MSYADEHLDVVAEEYLVCKNNPHFIDLSFEVIYHQYLMLFAYTKGLEFSIKNTSEGDSNAAQKRNQPESNQSEHQD